MIKKSKLLLFGGNGTIGTSIKQLFEGQGWDVWIVGRQKSEQSHYVCWNPVENNNAQEALQVLTQFGPYDAVCWAQGMNLNDSIFDFDMAAHQQMYEANVVYILNSLNILLSEDMVKKPAKFCVVSSIWQNISRQNKLSYSVTKSALQGLVLSAANDLGREGHLINAVLPGALETPMTRANLSEEQIAKIERSTQFNKLAELDDVANSVYSVCSEINTGLTGNFITVDLGFSHVRNL